MFYPNFDWSDINIVYIFEFMESTFVDRDGRVDGNWKRKAKENEKTFRLSVKVGKVAESDQRYFTPFLFFTPWDFPTYNNYIRSSQ